MIAYAIVVALALALAVVVWRAGRARWPLTIARSIGVVIVLGGTALGLWALHEAGEAAASGRAVGDAFSRLGTGWK
jgi:hypothetical protein